MKGIISTVLLLTFLPTLAIATGTCEPNETSTGCASYDGCYFLTTNATCKTCDFGTYNNDSLGSPDECKSCANEIPGGAEQTDFTQENCPWKLTCSANTYFDNNEKKCVPCNDGYESAEHLVEYDGGNTPNDSDACHPKSCFAGQYRSDKTQKCEPCPTGSTSAEGAKAQTDCYMNSETQFCDGSGVCIGFNTVFGDVTISYDATDE